MLKNRGFENIIKIQLFWIEKLFPKKGTCNLDAIMTLVPEGFLCVLRIHYISGRPFSVVLLLTPNFFEYFTFPSINSHFSMFYIVQVLFSSTIIPTLFKITLTLFRMGIFGAAHGWGCAKSPLPKICHT